MSDGVQMDVNLAYSINMPLILGVDRAVELNNLKKQAGLNKTDLEKFSAEMNQVIDEQTEYVIELESLQMEMDDLQESYEQELDSTLERYLELKEKAFNGNLTEDEAKELDLLEDERAGLVSDYRAKSQSAESSIEAVRQNYQSAENKTASNLIAQTNSTIDGLTQWNSDNNSETGKKILKRFNQSNNVIINDLSSRIDDVEEQNKIYSKYSSFLKK